MKSYRVVYSIKGHVDVEAEDGPGAMNEFENSSVKRILEKSAYEKIDTLEVDEEFFRDADPELDSLININQPEDAKEAIKRLDKYSDVE